MNRAARSLRKTLDMAAENNEAAALAVMRAVDHVTGDDVLKQRLLNVIQRLHQDADDLRKLRDRVIGSEFRQ